MSALGPFDVTPIVQRLREQVPALETIGVAVDVAAAQKSAPRLPAGFVLLKKERLKSELMTGVMRHQASAQVWVLIGVRHYQGRERGAAHADLGIPLVNQVRQALNGWTPAGPDGATVEPMRSEGDGELIGLTDAEWWWRDPFTLNYRSRR